MEVRFADGVWYRGRLVGRVAGTKSPRWSVQFDNGQTRDDIQLTNPAVPVRFDAGAYGETVEVRFDGEWRRGRLVELVREVELWGVAFEDGDWAENVRLGDPDMRYVFAGRGVEQERVQDQGQGSTQRVGTEEGQAERSDGQGQQGKHVCETCGKTFSQASSLAGHMRTHGVQKCGKRGRGEAAVSSGPKPAPSSLNPNPKLLHHVPYS